MIELHQFPIDWVLPSPSPFCLKVETWLRMAGIPYENVAWTPQSAPMGKAPFVVHEGRTLADSSVILRELTAAFDVQLDAGLSDEERATALLVQRTLEEHTYWGMLQVRWIDDAGWARYRHVIGSMLPALARPMLLPVLRRGVVKSARAHGLGRHDRDEVLHRACADLDALASILGEGPYLFGDVPRSIDAVVYAFLAQAAVPEPPNELQEHVAGRPGLMANIDGMRARYWAEET